VTDTPAGPEIPTVTPAMPRAWDIVVFGATGFAGRLIARYLARHIAQSAGHAAPGLKLAIAGRSRDKLEAIRAGLADDGLDVTAIGIIIASVDDPASLAAMARSCRVLVTTVGPYMRHGLPVVAACVAAGTDYIDLTGEPGFVAAITARHDAEARANGSLVIPCCGFDSIPTDLGVLFTIKQLPAGLPIKIEGYFEARASFSGGTFASALGAFAELGRARPRRPVVDESAAPGRVVRREPGRLHYQKALRRWALPMPTIDPQIALRSARSRGDYGPEFRYGHYLCMKSLPQLGLMLAGVGALVALAQTRPTRALLERLRPSGTGPSRGRASGQLVQVHLLRPGGRAPRRHRGPRRRPGLRRDRAHGRRVRAVPRDPARAAPAPRRRAHHRRGHGRAAARPIAGRGAALSRARCRRRGRGCDLTFRTGKIRAPSSRGSPRGSSACTPPGCCSRSSCCSP
jgi:short subunit dehydrogenase-like uncharacterized protein